MAITALKLDSWTGILPLCKDYNTVADICRKNGMTYSHVKIITGLLKKKKFIDAKKMGRKNIIELTEKGIETISLIRKINEKMK